MVPAEVSKIHTNASHDCSVTRPQFLISAVTVLGSGVPTFIRGGFKLSQVRVAEIGWKQKTNFVDYSLPTAPDSASGLGVEVLAFLTYLSNQAIISYCVCKTDCLAR